jgi:hypothetical protein
MSTFPEFLLFSHLTGLVQYSCTLGGIHLGFCRLFFRECAAAISLSGSASLNKKLPNQIPEVYSPGYTRGTTKSEYERFTLDTQLGQGKESAGRVALKRGTL